MKCEKAKKLVLLKDSGERSQSNSRLAAHLDSCHLCRDFQKLTIAARDATTAVTDPDIKTVQAVLRQARVAAPTRKHRTIYGWKQAVAAAASVAIGLGIFFSTFAPGKVGLELVVSDTQMMNSEDQFINVMYSGLSEDDLAFNFLMFGEEG